MTAVTYEQLESLYKLVEQIGDVQSNCFILARTNQITNTSKILIYLPSEATEFPWASHAVVLNETDHAIEFILEPAIKGYTTIGNQVCRVLAVPRKQLKNSKKCRNIFAPQSYIQKSPELRAMLESVCPKYPLEFLSYLLCPGLKTFKFDTTWQVRIAASPAWLQDAEYQNCAECKQRMQLIIQLPGTLLDNHKLRRGVYYLFGCIRQPHIRKTVAQFS